MGVFTTITDKAKALWVELCNELSTKETEVKQEITDLEAEFLPAFHAFISTQLGILGSQALSILKDELETIGATFLASGNVGEAIALSVPKVLAEVKSDVASDVANAKNAVYTAIGLKLSQVAQGAATNSEADPQATGTN